MANSVDPDQMLHSAAWVYIVCKAILSWYLGLLLYIQAANSKAGLFMHTAWQWSFAIVFKL